MTIFREILKFQESLEERTVGLDCLLVLDKADIPEDMEGLADRVVSVSSTIMKRLSGLQSIESIEAVGVMKIPTTFFNLVDHQEVTDCKLWFPSAHRILVLDGIQVSTYKSIVLY